MTSTYQPAPIIKAAERLLQDIEQAVRQFVRYHKYRIGGDLRRTAAEVYRLADRAWRDRSNQVELVGELVWKVDELRQHLQIAKLIQATTRFRQFEHLARQVNEVGKQAGGWRRELRQSMRHPNGQNAEGRRAVPQRAKILSTRTASVPAGANP